LASFIKDEYGFRPGMGTMLSRLRQSSRYQMLVTKRKNRSYRNIPKTVLIKMYRNSGTFTGLAKSVKEMGFHGSRESLWQYLHQDLAELRS